MPTNNRLQRHWTEARDFIREKWSKMSETELDNIAGNYDRFLFCLSENYGGFPALEAEARDLLQGFLNEMDRRHPERIVPDR